MDLNPQSQQARIRGLRMLYIHLENIRTWDLNPQSQHARIRGLRMLYIHLEDISLLWKYHSVPEAVQSASVSPYELL